MDTLEISKMKMFKKEKKNWQIRSFQKKKRNTCLHKRGTTR